MKIATVVPRTHFGDGSESINYENFAGYLEEASKLGFDLIDIHSRIGADNLNIGFLNPSSTNKVLIEFTSKG